jgi:pyridoxamine 5'-phosphate oxidase
MSIAELRREYTRASLSEEQVADNPVAQFAKWFDEALRSEVPEPNAMSVSTVAAGGLPSSRILLLKDFDERGFTWYTNYESRKGEELQHNPHAALLFFWQPLERQVRLEGSVERQRRRSGRLLQHPPAGKPARGAGIRAKPTDPIAASAGRTLPASRTATWRFATAAAALGWLSAAARVRRILAGPGIPPARSDRL